MIDLDEVVLRPFEPDDVRFLYRFRNDWSVIRFLGGFSAGYSRKNLADWILAHRNRADEVLLAIADKRTNDCIGHVGLYQIDNRIRKAEFAILIGDKQWWGRGIGRKATEAMIDFGFRELNLHKITLGVLSDNARAARLYDTLGFRREGTLRHEQFRAGKYLDLVLMSILENEWAQRKTRPRRKAAAR